jgi:uncharacterized protein YbjT (DUF2867 family)
MTAPVIAVFGATGRLGGSVVRALLARRASWRVRAVTRHPLGRAALALAAQGVEVQAADLDDAASLVPALRGASGAFCLTDFWAHGDAERELRQVRHLADAAAATGSLKQLIWTTQEDTRRCLPVDGPWMPQQPRRFLVPAMDAKGEANALFLERGLPVTLLLTPFIWDQLLMPGMGPWRMREGGLVLAMPLGQARLPGIAAADFGVCAAALFGESPAQRRVGIASEHPTGEEMAAAFAELWGEPVRYVDLPHAQYARQAFSGAADWAKVFAFLQRCNHAYCEARPVALTRALHAGSLDFSQWLRLHAGRWASSAALASRLIQ